MMNRDLSSSDLSKLEASVAHISEQLEILDPSHPIEAQEIEKNIEMLYRYKSMVDEALKAPSRSHLSLID